MRVNKAGKLEAKKRLYETETIVTVREECVACEGTGLISQGMYCTDCYKCHGRGMVQVSQQKEISRERK